MMQFIAWCVFGSSFIFFDTFCQLVLLLCWKFEGFAWSSDHITIFRDDHLNFSRPSCSGRPWGTGPLPGTLNVLLDNEGELTLIVPPFLEQFLAIVPLPKLCIWFWIVAGKHFIERLKVLVIAIIALLMEGSWELLDWYSRILFLYSSKASEKFLLISWVSNDSSSSLTSSSASSSFSLWSNALDAVCKSSSSQFPFEWFLHCLGYGHGGKSLVDTKIKKAEKPEWWPSKLTFGQYDHPSKESLQKNEFLIEGILTYFNYDVLSHCDSPPAIQKNQRRRRRTKITSKTCQRSPLRTDTSWKVG